MSYAVMYNVWVKKDKVIFVMEIFTNEESFIIR